jgi:sarcosine oxidase subunit alpha
MTVDGRPNVSTCHTLVQEDMQVEPQSKNNIDFLSAADKLSWLIPVGFYYKRFHKPSWLWPYVLKQMRSAGGNHAHLSTTDRDLRFDHVNLTPDLLVIGGGLAGLEAALVGAQAGVRVVLVEYDHRLGGTDFLHEAEGQSRLKKLISDVSAAENVTVLLSTHAAALYPDGTAFCVQTNVEGNFGDRPGIFLPEALLKLVHLYGLTPQKPVLFAGGDDHMAHVAIQLTYAGAQVAGLVDYRNQELNPVVLDELAKNGIPVFPKHQVIRAMGNKCVEGVEIAEINSASSKKIPAEAIVVSGGRSPRHKLLGMIGAKIDYNDDLHMHLPVTLPAGYFAAGRLMGLVDREAIGFSGRLAGGHALASLGLDMQAVIAQSFEALKAVPGPIAVTPHPIKSTGRGKAFVCFCHDVTQKDVSRTIREGFDNIESAKRYTTATMGACQGSSCHDNFSRLVSHELREKTPTNPLTTPRPTSISMSLGALAAGHHIMAKQTPIHDVQIQHGGKPTRIGPWIRMEHFGNPEAEIKAVHETAGIYDASTLGKFLLYGPDAEKLWNFVNTNNIERLEKNKIFHTATCNEEGVPIDDGIVIKLADGKVYFTTSTARAPMTPAWYRKWCRENGWTAYLVNWTDKMGGFNLTGPNALDILETLTGKNVSNETLPHMHWCEMEIEGVECYLFRLGFTGELGYEVHCPSSYLPDLWQKIFAVGLEYGLKPFGTEALLACRLEKGHILPGIDTDGDTTLHGAFGNYVRFLWDRSKPDMVGGPILKCLDGRSRMGVVGFSIEADAGISNGFIIKEGTRRRGHVTSVCYSQALGKTIGLALVDNHEEIKKTGSMIIFGGGQEVVAHYQKPPFYDPKGERMKI